MSGIRQIFQPVNGQAQQPHLPATIQHPDCVRYQVGLYIVDTIGPEPTLEEIERALNPPAAVQEINAAVAVKRGRAAAIEEIERRMNFGASQGDINAALLNLLKE